MIQTLISDVATHRLKLWIELDKPVEIHGRWKLGAGAK
jgi:hypothetical protein